MATKKNAQSLVSNLGIGQPRKAVNSEQEPDNRPSVEKGCKSGDTRTTIILNKELVRKVKYIALAEGSTIKDKVTEGLKTIVEQWEFQNGPVPLK